MGKIYIIQHCQSEHHVNEITGGWTDTPLTELGKKQAKAVVRELALYDINNPIIYTSDLKRAYMTAEYIFDAYQVQPIVLQELREHNNGNAKDKTKKWAKENNMNKDNTFSLDQVFWENSETYRELYNRMKDFIESIDMTLDRDIIIVSHGVAIAYMLVALTKKDPEILKDFCFRGNAGGISILEKSMFQQTMIKNFNLISHLRGL